MDGEKSIVQDEKVLKAKSGYAMLLLGIIGMLLGVAVIIAGSMMFVQTGETNAALLAGSIILGVLLIVGFILELCGLRVLNPNEAGQPSVSSVSPPVYAPPPPARFSPRQSSQR